MLVAEDGLDLLGTGVLVSHSDSLYVATARHVYRDLNGRALFAIPTPLPVKMAPGGHDEIRRRYGEVRRKELFRLPVADYVESGALADVALIRLPSTPAELVEMAPFLLESARSNPLPNGRRLRRRVRRRPVAPCSERRMGDVPSDIGGRFMPAGNRLYESYDETTHLLIRFEHSRGELHPGGMSGGGVWAIQEMKSGQLWSPGDPVLVALQTAWYSNHPDQPLKATRIEHLKALLP